MQYIGAKCWMHFRVEVLLYLNIQEWNMFKSSKCLSQSNLVLISFLPLGTCVIEETHLMPVSICKLGVSRPPQASVSWGYSGPSPELVPSSAQQMVCLWLYVPWRLFPKWMLKYEMKLDLAPQTGLSFSAQNLKVTWKMKNIFFIILS